ncbi:NAD(P)-binding Rossmann-fold superfamily protein [Prunus dulcis]|uniref:NAD(P)-binding Rossmann-fold superfamily protein n=1 Tax=Prunus dulcis TaxID=3755 RepID=A0A4Y1RJS4_PRUDU|nr:NAD(P)-binding Rossmann-fold superfamily protein [Prunus dulcis]
MATTAASSLQMATARPCMSSSRRAFVSSAAMLNGNFKLASWTKLSSACHIASTQPFHRSFTSSSLKMDKFVTKAMAGASENKPASGLPIDLKGKRAFIAGVADDNGYGWAIAKSLAAAGAEILVGTWVPVITDYEELICRLSTSLSPACDVASLMNHACKMLDLVLNSVSRLPDGSLMEITKIYPLDAVFDNPEDVPEDIKTNKRYAGSSKWTVQEAAESVKSDFGSVDILVHSLANGPEVVKPLLETSRKGYLAALSASSGSSISLTYIASERIIPGYGGGMSSAKAALESDTRVRFSSMHFVHVLAFEAGRRKGIRVNAISAGPLRSRAAKAIGFIDMMIDYSSANAPLQKELSAEEVGNTAAFLASPLASAITGGVIYVDNGLNAMGVGVDSPIFEKLDIPKAQH